MNLEQTLNTRFDKQKMKALLSSDDHAFEEAVQLALTAKRPTAWRAAWMLKHAMADHDPRLTPHVPALVKALPGKDEGHQRELLNLLDRLSLDEDSEGLVLEHCMGLWERIGLTPSVRYTAFKFILKFSEKYPMLREELPHLLEEHYVETLSQGIRRSLKRRLDNEIF